MSKMSEVDCFVFGSETFGGHEIMAAKIVSQMIHDGRKIRILASQVLFDHLRKKIVGGFDYFELRHKERRLEFSSGWLNPFFISAYNELRRSLVGCRSVTMVNGGVNANHTLSLACATAARFGNVKAFLYFPMLHEPSELSLHGLRGAFYRLAQERAIKVFGNFITIDEFWRDRLLSRAPHYPDVKVIHNFVHIDMEAFAQKDASSARTTERICFVGRLDRDQKGLDLLVEVLEHLSRSENAKPTEWVFIGDGPFREELIEACERLQSVKLKFEFHGWVQNPHDLMKGCRALVLPSRAEGVSTVVVEALILGLEVFAFDIPGMERLLPKSILITPFDTPGMARAIEKLLLSSGSHYEKSENEYVKMLSDSERFAKEVREATVF